MKLSYNWLKEFLDLDEITPKQLANKIEKTSVEVDDVKLAKHNLDNVVVGKVVTSRPLANSAHLHIVKVDIGKKEPIQVICGAPNIKVGGKVIVALPGSNLPHIGEIKKTKIKGIDSNGMLTSLEEVGINKESVPKEWEHKRGIYYLPNDSKVGNLVASYLGLDDDIINLSVTPNRGDMLSLRGILYELGAVYNKNFSFNYKPTFKSIDSKKDTNFLSIKTNNDQVPMYAARIINNVKVKASPLWLQRRLWNADIRPINNVVDITNYIMLKLGQPLHAYDLSKLPGKDLSVRFAKNNEEILTLNGEVNNLTNDDLVVSSGNQPIALAGVMGGEKTKIDLATKDIVIEAADFKPNLVRKTAKNNHLSTFSSYRFERDVDPNNIINALNLASDLIEKLGDGKVINEILTSNKNQNFTPTNIIISLVKINDYLGTKLSPQEVEDIFKRLGFKVKSNKNKDNKVEFSVTIPTRRPDIKIDSDLIEEVGRIYGYDKIPDELPSGSTTEGGLSKNQEFIHRSRTTLEGLGLNQVISYSLTTNKKANLIKLNTDQSAIVLPQPLSSDRTTLRMNLISGLLDDVAYNQSRGIDDVKIYEQGRIFYNSNDSKNRLAPKEIEHIAGAVSGKTNSSSWNFKSNFIDFFQLKGLVQSYLDSLHLKGYINYKPTNSYPMLHPGQSAEIYIDNTLVGIVGKIHPRVGKKFKIKPTFVFELDLSKILTLPRQSQTLKPVSIYPIITRDMALLVKDNILSADIINEIKQSGGKYLRNIDVFDVYKGKNIPKNEKSLAYSLTFQKQDDTLKDKEVDESISRIKHNLEDKFKVKIR